MTSYDAIVTAATVGLGQRPLSIDALPGSAAAHAGVLSADPVEAVLDAAALLGSARRAGRRTGTADASASAAAAESQPELGPVAAMLRGPAVTRDPLLLADLLTAVASAGLVVPAPVLPTLLDAATRDRGLRGRVAPVLGERGRWLAGLQAEWAWAAPEPPAADGDEVWRTGSLAQRVAYIRAQRRADPAGARDLLTGGWAHENGEARAQLVAVLDDGLGPEDEALLERALDDRRPQVRDAARQLLARLPGSAFTARAVERARPLLHVERHALRKRLVLAAPDDVDDTARRDGLGAAPTSGRRSWLVANLVAATPLDAWPVLLGEPPETLAVLPIDGGFGEELHAGWRRAALDHRDPVWARALLRRRDPERPGRFWVPDAQLAAALPPAERARRATERLGAGEPGADIEAAGCPGPWPDELAAAVVEQLHRTLRGPRPAPPHHLVRALGRNAPLTGRHDYARDLRELDLTAQAAVAGLAGVRDAANVIELRRRFLQELT